MHITLEADYAVRIVYCLAASGKRMDAKTVAENTGVTLRFSLKIMRKLVGSGIIRSYKGTQGGYEIAKPLDEVSMYDIIETVEGPYVLSRCLREDFCCVHAKDEECIFQKVYDEVTHCVKDRLSAVRLSDLLRQGQEQRERKEKLAQQQQLEQLVPTADTST